ncbi:MAG: hypothetical protein HY925_13500 [Elusimicrobia bacterium]|nr:hypothetical protein [Elusimicrobiota bacterium]
MIFWRGATGLALLWTAAALWRGGVVWTPAFLAALFGLFWLCLAEKRAWESRPELFLFLASSAIYLSSFRWHGGDDLPTSLVPFALLRDHTFALDGWLSPFLDGGKAQDFTIAVQNGHRISIYPVAGALLALPFYILPALSGLAPTEVFLHNISKVSATAIAAVTVAILYRALAAKTSREWAFTLAACFAFGTWSFSLSSQALWQHGPATLGIALGLWGFSQTGFRADVLAGFGFAFAASARPDNFWLAAAAGLCVLANRRSRVLGFSLGAAVPAVLLVGYWVYYSGKPVPPESDLQRVMFTGFQPEAFAALLVSPTRGLLWYSPFVLFGAWAAVRRGTAESRWLLGGSVAAWIFFSCYGAWVGGGTYGARYFAGVCAVLTYALAEAEDELRCSKAFALAAGFSILVHALGAYLNWPGTSHLPTQKLQAWWWSLHPWLFLLSPEGGLKGLPMAGRVVAFLATGGLVVWGSSCLKPSTDAAASRAS